MEPKKINYEYVVSNSKKQQFLVIESTDGCHIGSIFECHTHIRNEIILPFSVSKFKVIEFNGIKIKLMNNNTIIVGSLL